MHNKEYSYKSETKQSERDIFLSHRSTDKEFTRRLAADIEDKEFEGRNLLTWIDEAEIRAGQSVTAMINQGLEKSRFIGIVMTRSYFTSESGWTDAEWHAALYRDPDNRRGRIIPLLAADCPYIPILLRHLMTIDFRGNNYQKGLRQLISVLRNEPLPRRVTFRGQLLTPTLNIDRATLIAERAVPQSDPDVKDERLFCNLLPVQHLPTYVYIAPISRELYKTRKDGSEALPSKECIKDAIHATQKERSTELFTPAFRIFEDKIVTFHDLESSEGTFTSVIDEHEIEPIETIGLLQDEDNRRLVVSLLNMAINRHAHSIGLAIDNTKPRRFFFPPKDGGPNVVNWKPIKKKATRTVAKPCLKDGEVQFWRHQGAYLKMMFLANRFYLQIIPTWVFTENGFRVKTGPTLGRLVIRWTGPERNLNLLYHIRFWTRTLQKGYGPMIEIRAGDQRLEIGPKPAFIIQTHGIADDYKDLMELLDEQAMVIADSEDQLADMAVEEEIEYLEELAEEDKFEAEDESEAEDIDEEVDVDVE